MRKIIHHGRVKQGIYALQISWHCLRKLRRVKVNMIQLVTLIWRAGGFKSLFQKTLTDMGKKKGILMN